MHKLIVLNIGLSMPPQSVSGVFLLAEPWESNQRKYEETKDQSANFLYIFCTSSTADEVPSSDWSSFTSDH